MSRHNERLGRWAAVIILGLLCVVALLIYTADTSKLEARMSAYNKCRSECQNESKADREYLLESLRGVEEVIVLRAEEQGHATVRLVYNRLVTCEAKMRGEEDGDPRVDTEANTDTGD